MLIPEEHKIKWEAEVAKAVLVWTNGRDTAETLENDYSDGIIDIEDVWAFMEGKQDALSENATEGFQAFLEESLYEVWLAMSNPLTARVASRHMGKVGADKFG